MHRERTSFVVIEKRLDRVLVDGAMGGPQASRDRLRSCMDTRGNFRIDRRAVSSRGQSADAREGIEAFFAKRAAQFPDTVSGQMPAFFPWWTEPHFEQA